MKKIYNAIITVLSIIALAFFMSCEGPAGPAGTTGANGVDGVNGTDGTPGVDGNVSCLVCHTQSGMDALTSLYDLSGHKAAGAVAYAGARYDCSQCHSHEGFQNFLAATPGAELADIDYPTRITCGTCHSSHGSLEDDIVAPIAIQTAVTAISDGTVLDFGSNANLCANCHQSRRDYTYYEAVDSVSIDGVMTPVGDGDVGINSSHAGPHHGPQANLLLGNGGYGNTSVGKHTELACTSCHLGTADATSGGHSFKPSLANCTGCHSGATDFDVNGKQTEFDTRMAAIGDALVTAGALSYEDGAYHPHVSIVSDSEFKGFWNFMLLMEDASRGVHNPSYFNTLLTTAEANLNL